MFIKALLCLFHVVSFQYRDAQKITCSSDILARLVKRIKQSLLSYGEKDLQIDGIKAISTCLLSFEPWCIGKCILITNFV
jgi:hypothetical protein